VLKSPLVLLLNGVKWVNIPPFSPIDQVRKSFLENLSPESFASSYANNCDDHPTKENNIAAFVNLDFILSYLNINVRIIERSAVRNNFEKANREKLSDIISLRINALPV